MDTTTHHTLADLFAQLGLPGSAAEIKAFVARHKPLPDGLRLSEAPFWSDSQAAFLREQIRADDGDWALLVDQLNALLREHPKPDDLAQAGEADPSQAPEPLPSPATVRRWAEPAGFFTAPTSAPGSGKPG